MFYFINFLLKFFRICLGKTENLRLLNIALCRAIPARGIKISSANTGAAVTLEMEASDNPALQKGLFSTKYRNCLIKLKVL